MYGAKQAGNIWGSVLDKRLKGFGFITSKFDEKLYIFSRNNELIIIVIVVDDLAFASNSPHLLNEFKKCLSAEFDVKLYGKLTNLIDWNISYHPNRIKIYRQGYAKQILKNLACCTLALQLHLYLKMMTYTLQIRTIAHYQKTIILLIDLLLADCYTSQYALYQT